MLVFFFFVAAAFQVSAEHLLWLLGDARGAVVVFDSTTFWAIHRLLHKNGEPNQESGLTQGTASMYKGACSH